MKILAFAATNSRTSINKQLATYAAGLVHGAEVEVLDLNDYELPLYSQERQDEIGVPQLAQQFLDKIKAADAVVISFAEHNGSYSVAYKNLFDWASRIDMKVFADQPVVHLATSPGPGGAQNVLATANSAASFYGGDLKASVSVPNFFDNFDVEAGRLSNAELHAQMIDAVSTLAA